MSLRQQVLDIRRQKSTPNGSNPSRKVALEVSLATKQQCEAKALTVVLSLIETSVSEEYLIGVGNLIRRNHYQDVIEERALEKLCGYPLCDNGLKNVPAQKYRISAKSNKVYDISERKNFCCNQCFKCSKYLEEQLLTSPLWLEDEDDNVDQPLKLLNTDSNSGAVGIEVDFGKLTLKPEAEELSKLDKSAVGIEVDFGKLTLKPEVEELAKLDKSGPKTDHPNRSPVAEPLSAVCDNVCNGPMSPSKESQTLEEEQLKPRTEVFNTGQVENETSKEEISTVELAYSDTPHLESAGTFCAAATPVNKESVVVQESQVKSPRSLLCTKDEKVRVLSNPFDIVEKRLLDWVTVNTAIFILGDQKFQDVLKDSERQSGTGHNAKRALEFQQHYTTLCRKLDLEEARDRKTDESLILDHDSDDEKVPDKPPPTLEELQTAESQLNVLAFYRGCMEPLATAPKEEQKTVNEVKFKRKKPRAGPQAKKGSTKKAVSSSDSGEILSFPLLDSLSQTALRRRIVLDRLNNACSELLDVLGLTRLDVAGGLRKLVQTLRLDAKNITLKPAEWPFIVIVFIKLLAIRDAKLQHALDSKTSILFLNTLFKGICKPVTCIDTVVEKLLDVNILLNKTLQII